MNEKTYRRIDRKTVWHPYTKRSAIEDNAFPVITRAKGPWLYDSEGRRYLDAVSSWWCCNLGHCQPAIVKAIAGQAKKLDHSILGNMSHPRAIELAERICALFQGGRHVMFASDGASAVEAALKIALQYWHNRCIRGKTRFAALKDGYHGDTLGAVSVGYVKSFHAPYRNALRPSFVAEAPFCAACAWGKNSATCKAECFESMARLLQTHGRQIAAVIVEPLCQGAAGMRIYSPKYLRKLDAACRKHNVLLIADEIAVGMGRTGRMFAFEHAGIDPDIVCIGKGITGGSLPLSATVVKDRLYGTFDDRNGVDNTFYHGHTFTGNPIACAAAIATLDLYRTKGIVRRAEQMGRMLADHMDRLACLRGVTRVRSLGMIGAFDIKSARKLADILRAKHGILVRPLGNTVYLMLPLTVTAAVLKSTMGAIEKAIRLIGGRM